MSTSHGPIVFLANMPRIHIRGQPPYTRKLLSGNERVGLSFRVERDAYAQICCDRAAESSKLIR